MKAKFTQAMRMDLVRAKLVERAKAKKLIEYGEFLKGNYGVARGDGVPWKIGYVLTEINKQELKKNRPILSSVCVLKSTRMPESAYWKMPYIPVKIKKGTSAQKKTFWIEQRDKVFSYPYP